MQRKLIIVDFHLLRDTGPRPSSTGDNPLIQATIVCNNFLICLQQVAHSGRESLQQVAHLLAMVAHINLTIFN